MAGLIEPGSFIQAGGLDHERIVAVPVAHRIAVKSGVGVAARVHFLGKFSSVHPDFAPNTLLLVIDDDAARRRAEQRAATAADGVRQKIARKPERITDDEWVIRGREIVVAGREAIRQVGKPRLEQRLAGGRHGGHGLRLVILRSDPSSRKILLGSGPRRIGHLRNSVGDVTIWQLPPSGPRSLGSLGHRDRRKHQYNQHSSHCFGDRISHFTPSLSSLSRASYTSPVLDATNLLSGCLGAELAPDGTIRGDASPSICIREYSVHTNIRHWVGYSQVESKSGPP